MVRRLFLFAAYDAQGIVDATLLHYLRVLSKLGDIIVTMDNNIAPTEQAKFSDIPNILHVAAARHGEYDFGSYKRCYQYARGKKLLEKYDWVYLVNDSVVGPLFDLGPILKDLESRGADFTGLFSFADDGLPLHLQSWFVGFSRALVQSQVLDEFLGAVTAQKNKNLIVFGYEYRLTQLLLQSGYKMAVLVDGEPNDMDCIPYTNPVGTLKRGIPFVKKAMLTRLPALYHILPFTTPQFVSMVQKYMDRTIKNSNEHRTAISDNIKVFRFALLSLPLLGVYRRWQTDCRNASYKIYLFDKLPIAKVTVHKN